jgi:hypothetical protein
MNDSHPEKMNCEKSVFAFARMRALRGQRLQTPGPAFSDPGAATIIEF